MGDRMEKHFTATAYIIDAEKVLLIYHKKINKWLPPGGHIDPNETPPEAVKREVLEETGLEIEIFKNEHVWIDDWNAKSIERPYMCLLENIPEHESKPAHQHIDMIFIAYPTGGSIKENERETSGIRWFTLEDIELLKPDKEIFVETIETLRNIFKEQALILQSTGK